MSAPKNYREINLMPMELDRSTDPLLLDGNKARVLDHADIGYFYGRVRRGPGWVRMQPEATTAGQSILNAAVIVARTCERFIIDSDDEGNIRLFPSDGSTICSGPLPHGGSLPSDDEDAGETLGTDPNPGSGSYVAIDPDIPSV